MNKTANMKEYKRLWHIKNKDEVHKRHHQNYLDNREEILKRHKTWEESHKEERKNYFKEYRLKNKDKINRYFKENKLKHSLIRHNHYLKNKKMIRLKNKIYVKKHRERLTEYSREYKRNFRRPSAKERELLLDSFDKCIYCGSKNHLGIDHIIPYSSNDFIDIPQNTVIACNKCNSEKSSKDIFYWYVQQDKVVPTLIMERLIQIAEIQGCSLSTS